MNDYPNRPLGNALTETDCSAMVFRVKGHWMALPTTLLLRVMDIKQPHTIPARTDNRLLGLVNVGGEPVLCFSLADMLDMKEVASGERMGEDHPRLVIAEGEGTRFAFAVDAILGVCEVPTTGLASSDEAATLPERLKNMRQIKLGGMEAKWLDERILNAALARSLCHGAG